MSDARSRVLLPSLVTAALAASAGCSSSESSSSDGGEGGTPITTRQMYISATVEAEDDATTEISVSLHNGDLLGTYFSLTGGDALSACVGARCSPLTREPLGSEYEAELPYAAETPYTISLARAGGVSSAPNSVVALPVPFTILAPAPHLRVTDGDSVTVQWAPAGADDIVDVRAETLCHHDDPSLLYFLPSARSELLATNVDTGTIVADVDTILDSGWSFFSREEPIVRCEIAIEVVHRRVGTIDTSLGGGIVRGLVSRKVTLDYTPQP